MATFSGVAAPGPRMATAGSPGSSDISANVPKVTSSNTAASDSTRRRSQSISRRRSVGDVHRAAREEGDRVEAGEVLVPGDEDASEVGDEHRHRLPEAGLERVVRLLADRRVVARAPLVEGGVHLR